MVARGDLGVEIPHEEVPGRQKELRARLPARGQAGDRRDPDARIHGARPRHRRGPRHRTWRPRSMTAPMPSCCRRSCATGQLSPRSGGDDGPDHPQHRAAHALSIDHRGLRTRRGARRRRTRSPRPRRISPSVIEPPRSWCSRRAARPRRASSASVPRRRSWR